MSFVLTLAACAGAVAPPTSATGRVSGPIEGVPVKNYGIVDEGLLSRSGQPTSHGYAWLRQQGVKGIANLTGKDAGESFLKELGFESYLWLPMDGPPNDDAQAERFLRFVRDSQSWPVHVHCHAGKDRTGVMVALFRYAVDGWPLEKALKEARAYRAGKDLLSEYIEWLNRWAESHPPGSQRPVGYGDGGKNDAR